MSHSNPAPRLLFLLAIGLALGSCTSGVHRAMLETGGGYSSVQSQRADLGGYHAKVRGEVMRTSTTFADVDVGLRAAVSYRGMGDDSPGIDVDSDKWDGRAAVLMGSTRDLTGWMQLYAHGLFGYRHLDDDTTARGGAGVLRTRINGGGIWFGGNAGLRFALLEALVLDIGGEWSRARIDRSNAGDIDIDFITGRARLLFDEAWFVGFDYVRESRPTIDDVDEFSLMVGSQFIF